MSGNEEQHRCLAAYRCTPELPLIFTCILRIDKVRLHTCLFYHYYLLESMRDNKILFRSINRIYKKQEQFHEAKINL